MHTRYRLMNNFWVINLTIIVAINTNPGHFPPIKHLFFADHGNIILRLAGNRTGIATSASSKVDNHAPSVTSVLMVRAIV